MRPTEYDLYIVYVKQWLKDHCSPVEVAAAKGAYKADVASGNFEGTWIDWLIETGINGMAPACFPEWYDNEYEEERKHV